METNIDNQFWIDAWENNQFAFHQNKPNPWLKQFLEKKNLNYNHAFVPLCGKSLDLLYLAQFYKKVSGVEISKKAILSFFEENNLEYTESNNAFTSRNITIYLKDIFDLELDTPVDFIYDRASAVALPFNTRFKYFTKIKSFMSESSSWLLLSLEYDTSLKQGPPFSIPEDEIKKNCDPLNINKYLSENNQAAQGVAMKRTAYLIKK